jgi:glutamine synthetase
MARPREHAALATTGAGAERDRATSSVARRAVLKRIKDEGVEHVLFWFTDLEGHLKSFAITPTRCGRARRRDGVRRLVDHRLRPIEESDMVAIPDPATFELMPRPVDDHGHELGRAAA